MHANYVYIMFVVTPSSYTMYDISSSLKKGKKKKKKTRLL